MIVQEPCWNLIIGNAVENLWTIILAVELRVIFRYFLEL